MRCLVILALFLCPFTPAQAGAWLRAEGTSFASSTFTINRLRDHDSSTYIEYGWGPDLTLGLDLSFASSSLGPQAGAATAFFRRALPLGSEKHKWAYEIGAGAAWTQGIVLPHVKLGLSYGRGFDLAGKSGWLAVDSAVFRDLNTGRHAIKVDSTLGVNFTDLAAAMAQVYFSRVLNNDFATFAPSLLISPKGRNYTLQLGIEAPIFTRAEPSVKLGLWRSF